MFTWNDAFTWNEADLVANVRRWPDHKPMFRVVAEADGKAIGYGRACQVAENPRDAFAGELIVLPDHQQRGIGSALLDECERFAREGGAKCLTFMVHERWPYAKVAAGKLGYEPRTLYYQSIVDPQAFDPEPFVSLLDSLSKDGYEIKPLIDLPLSEETDRAYFNAVDKSDTDTPFMDYFGWPNYEDYRKMVMGSQWFDRNGVFVALFEGEVVGASTVNKGSIDFNGEMFIDYTGVVPEHRNKGLATAMKARALEYAKRVGGTMVRTENNDANPAMRKVNKRLGFVEKPGMWMVVKDL